MKEADILHSEEAKKAEKRREATQLAGRDKEGETLFKSSVTANWQAPKEEARKAEKRYYLVLYNLLPFVQYWTHGRIKKGGRIKR